jgi:hypothetical protein
MSLPFDLGAVSKVTFYKRDELTTDLICCDVETKADKPQIWFNHEESETWQEWLGELAKLPGFDAGWHSKVSQPAFEPGATVAFERSSPS